MLDWLRGLRPLERYAAIAGVALVAVAVVVFLTGQRSFALFLLAVVVLINFVVRAGPRPRTPAQDRFDRWVDSTRARIDADDERLEREAELERAVRESGEAQRREDRQRAAAERKRVARERRGPDL